MVVAFETETMPKKIDQPPKQMGRPPSEEGPRKQILSLRGRDDYKEWLIRFALSERSDVADLVDDALTAYAKAKKFESPPMR